MNESTDTHASKVPAGLMQKQRSGLQRVWYALGYSLAGLRAAWHETAFRQEALLAFVLVPLSFWVGRNWVETALLAGSVIGVMIVELLNTGIEAAVDRMGLEWNAYTKKAKDMGSAAVLLSLLTCAGIWMAALWKLLA
jgi:diacylglycerol kinase (ATP)